MSRDKYAPDYNALYPGVEISEEVLAVLKESDGKMKYQEYDRKREKWKIDQSAQTATCKPSLEDSYERLIEVECQFSCGDENVEDAVIRSIMLEKLPSCLDRLDEDERDLVHALFYDELTIRDCAERFKTTKSTIDRRKQKILQKLEIFLKN